MSGLPSRKRTFEGVRVANCKFALDTNLHQIRQFQYNVPYGTIIACSRREVKRSSLERDLEAQRKATEALFIENNVFLVTEAAPAGRFWFVGGQILPNLYLTDQW
jgi:hypothetical protein